MKLSFRSLTSNTKRMLVLIISTAILLLGAVGTTIAFIVDRTETASNIFDPPVVRITLRDYDEITNIGTIPVYVRALAVVNWASTEDEHTILAEKPKVGEDLSITFISEDWFMGDDGFYYYKKVLHPEDHIALMVEAVQLTEKLGYEMELTILSSAIQISDEAINVAWPAVRINEDGELERATAP